jgi:manganese/zinc/iron transport system permease protein
VSGGLSMTELPFWPRPAEVWQVLTLADYNTRVVILGTACLGLAAGMIGTFMLLRRRALLGDALSHATLPGIALAFMVMVSLGGAGKNLPGLLLGATITGLLGVGCILVIRSFTRLKEDAALGIVLSVFFGLGVAALAIVQQMDTGSAAGLESFIYGKTASMLRSDALVMAGCAILVAVVCALLFKELMLICFDQGFAGTQGWPVGMLDLLLMALVTLVTVVGLQAVGLILVLAMLIIPPAAARFWTDRLSSMFIISAAIGALSGMIGAGASALFQRLPAGAVIVLVAAGFFTISMLLGSARGVLGRVWRRHALERSIARQNLLRSAYELVEDDPAGPIPADALLGRRSWSAGQLAGCLRRAESRGLLRRTGQGIFFTPAGLEEARRVVRNHRLWEIYLIRYADVAPSQVDHGADLIEHILGHDLVAELQAALESNDHLPASPHALPPKGVS